MYSVNNDFISAIKSSSRRIEPLVLIGGVALDANDIIEFDIDSNLGTAGLPSIGGAVSSKLNLKFIKKAGIDIIKGSVIDVFIKIQDDTNVWHSIPLGAFEPQIDNIVKTDLSVSVECLDLLAYYTKEPLFFEDTFKFPSNAYLVLKEVEKHTKLFFELTDSLKEITIKEKPKEDMYIRAFLSKVAEAVGANCIIDRYGKVKFQTVKNVDFKLEAKNYKSLNFETESESLISRLIIEKGYTEKNDQGLEVEVPDIVSGEKGGFVVRLNNEYINDQVHADKVFNTAKFPMKYWGYSLEGQGMPHLDVGDIIKVSDKHGAEKEIILVSHSIKYNGSLTSTMSAAATNKDIDNTVNTGSSVTDTIHKEIEELKENIVFYENNIEIKAKTRSNTLLQEMVILCKDKDAKAMASYSSCLESNNYGIIEFLIEINGDLELFKPKKTVDTGFNIVSFEMPLRKLRTDIANKVEVRMFADNTSFSIMPSQQQVIVRGTKIESGGNKDLPFTGGEHIEIVKLKPIKLTVKAHTEASISSQLKLAKRQDIQRKEIVKVVPTFVINLKGDKKNEQSTT